MGTPQDFRSAVIRHIKQNRDNESLRNLFRAPRYMPEKYVKARAVIFHGYSGHSEQPHIQHLVHILEQHERISTSLCDFPDHGLSTDPDRPKDHGKIRSFRRWVYTVYTMTYKTLGLRSKKNLGVFLIGYSAGALAILRFLQTHPEVQPYLAGVVLIAVPLEVDQNAAPWVLKYKRYLEPVFNMLAWFFPNMSVADLPEGNKDDPLEYNGKVRARTAKELRDAAHAAREAMSAIRVPILFIHGDLDSVALSAPVERAYQSVETPADKKRVIIYRGAPHKILHQAVDDVRAWIVERSKTKDWTPVALAPEDLNYAAEKTVKLASILLFALQEILAWALEILVDCRNAVYRAWQRVVGIVRRK